jgi:Xaa-Pro dipeptidase
MTRGVGGSTAEAELAKFHSMRDAVPPVGAEERRARIARAQALMRAQGIQALYLDASTTNFYFTGLRLRGSERLHGAVIPAEGEVAYITPAFEQAKLETMITLPGLIHGWHEHQDPTSLVVDAVRAMGYASGTIAIDPATPLTPSRSPPPAG